MILRAAHLAALERAVFETFIDRLAAHFRRPAWRIEQAVGCAYTAGHYSEAAIADFVGRWLVTEDQP